MRTFIISIGLAMLVASCVNPVQPEATNAKPPQPETTGSQTPNSEQQGKAFAISTTAFYQASLNSANSPGRLISLRLTPARKAQMTTDFLDAKKMVIDTGSWTTLASGNLMLHLTREGEPQPVMLEFKTEGEKLVYTGSEYGTGGLTFWVKPLPEAK